MTYIVDRVARFARGFLLSYGPSRFKKAVWDKEYIQNKWLFAENSASDCLYPFLEKYSNDANILDIGCGSGNTANEITATYKSYVGVDISEAALAKAAKRSRENGRQDKNRFVCSDFLTYVPTGKFDVILFRESLYHIPIGKILPILYNYSHHLNDTGVFIVRLYTGMNGKTKWRPLKMISIIENNCDIIEKYCDKSSATVVVFRPRRHVGNRIVSEVEIQHGAMNS